MKLSLSLPALERLIGGDNQIEIELRQQIAEKFAERHLKCLLNDTMLGQVQQKVTQFANGQIAALIADIGSKESTNRWASEARFRLHGPITDAIKQAVDDAISNKIAEAVQLAADTRLAGITRDVRGMIDRYLSEKKIEEMVNQGIKERLEAAASLVRDGKQLRSIDLGQGDQP